MWQVGSLQVREATGPQFEDFWAARDYAIKKSIDDSIYGIWDKDNNDDLVSIVFQGEEYCK